MTSKVVIIIALVGAVALLIPCAGIIAALAIPAFVTYLNRAKAAEADAMVTMIGDEVVASTRESCEFPPDLPSTADPGDCCGGGECIQDEDILRQWREAGVGIDLETSYFVYETERVDADTYKVRAVADFGCQEPNHTVEVIVEREMLGGGDCEVHQYPSVTMYEFE